MRELSVEAYSIDLRLLPINSPQKLCKSVAGKTGMGGQITGRSCVTMVERKGGR